MVLGPTVATGEEAGGIASTVLRSERGWPMPPLADALARYVAEREHAPVASYRERMVLAAASGVPVELVGRGDGERERRA